MTDCPLGPDCTTCPDFVCRALNEKMSEMTYDSSRPGAVREWEAEQRLIDQMTPRGKRALALQRAKGIYPEAPVAEHLVVADWLLVEPDVRQAGEDSGPVTGESASLRDVVEVLGPQEMKWTDSQQTVGELISKDYLDGDDEIAYFVVNGTSMYVTASRAEQIIAVLQRAISMAQKNA